MVLSKLAKRIKKDFLASRYELIGQIGSSRFLWDKRVSRLLVRVSGLNIGIRFCWFSIPLCKPKVF